MMAMRAYLSSFRLGNQPRRLVKLVNDNTLKKISRDAWRRLMLARSFATSTWRAFGAASAGGQETLLESPAWILTARTSRLHDLL